MTRRMRSRVQYAVMSTALLAAALLFQSGAMAQAGGSCQFDVSALQFQGSAVEQARCLLRRVSKWGRVDQAPAEVPPALLDFVGKPTGDLAVQLRSHLASLGIAESAVGGKLSHEVSRARGGSPKAPLAKYFVIHDTSSPWLGNKAFPPDDAPSVNRLEPYGGPESVAHVFVNRLGNTLVGHDFLVPWRATKLEIKQIGLAAKGLFLHIELVQPRRRDPAGGPKNDAIAPEPGFTQAQYDKLAILYVAASVRSGAWMIPAFHAVLDEGQKDAHDDPQNFELARFAAAVESVHAKLASQPAK